MSDVTCMATLDGSWELHPMLVLQPVDPHEGHGFSLSYLDVIRLIKAIDDNEGIEEDGFRIQITEISESACVEFPPGEPARNAVAAMRWYANALRAAGPMPATLGPLEK